MAEALNAREIFMAALDRPAADRAAYLDAACGGDPALRQRVEALLAAHDAPGAFLSEAGPPGGATATLPDAGPERTAAHRPAAEPGAVVAGRYALLERIGEGGMGEVWVARQTEPVKRKVAVKLIRAGMDSRQVLARFEAERQALALMDHPNIATVLDGGLHDGRPFFVMELVKGVPVTQFCDERRLTPPQRLELFVSVCQAIQHAHQKGIIHRDIKPSNVLVALYDDRPVVKVIDFGVAKATGGALTERTIDTGFGGVVGTPQYMSPEQATFNNLDVDTRSDVYALGVLLYELLTGSPPFARKELEKKGLLEILRVIREEEPPRPSTKLSTADALPTLSANRGTEPKKLTGLLRNELDWVVMKALEKDRTRRYETANAFAADVLRYLCGEAVQAHPPSATYRLKKFVRRNRGQVIAAGLVLFVLVAGIAGTTLGLFEARRQSGIARDETVEKEKARLAEAQRVVERDAALKEEAQRVVERDAALKREGERADELKHQLGVSNFKLAAAAFDNRNVRLAAERQDRIPPEQRGWEWHHLKQQTEGGIFTLYGHTGRVSCVCFSPDGARLATAGGDPGKPGEVRVWDARTGALQLELNGPAPRRRPGRPVRVCFSPDGTRLAVTASDGPSVASVWEVPPVRAGSVARTAKVLLELKGPAGPARCVAFSPDGTRIVTGHDNPPGVWVWDARTGKALLARDGHRFGVTGVAFGPDGTRIASAGPDRTVKVWAVPPAGPEASAEKGGAPLLEVTVGAGGDVAVAFSPDGTRIAAGTFDGRALVFDARTGQAQFELRALAPRVEKVFEVGGAAGGVLSVCFSPDGTRLLTAGGYSAIAGGAAASVEATVWEVPSPAPERADRTGKALFELKGHTGLVLSAAFSPDGTRIVTGSQDQTAKVWDARSGTPRLELGGGREDVVGVAFSADGTRVVTADGDFVLRGSHNTLTPSTATVWDVRTGEPLVRLKGFKGLITCVAFSRDGTRVVTGGVAGFGSENPGGATVWDARTGEPLVELKGFTQGVNDVAFSPDGTRIATAPVLGITGSGTELKVWDARTGAVLLDLTDPPPEGPFPHRRGGSVAFTADGTRLLTAGVRDKTNRAGDGAQVRDARTGAVLVELRGIGPVQSAALSPDGSRIAIGGPGTVTMWNARTGAPAEPSELKGHTGLVTGVCFSPDGARLVSGGGDRTVKVWDVRTGTELLELKGHTGFVTAVCFSPDGTKLATALQGNAGRPGEVLVWEARPVPGPRTRIGPGFGWDGPAAFSPDGTRLAAASRNGTLKVWETRTGAAVFDAGGPGGPVESVSFSRDGTRIVARGPGKSVQVWAADTGRVLPGEAVPELAPSRWTSSDDRLGIHTDGQGGRLVSLQPEGEELAYRLRYTRPALARYQHGYLVARAAGDAFAARFYLDLTPPTDRADLVRRADVNDLPELVKRVNQLRADGDRNRAVAASLELVARKKTLLGPDNPDTLEEMEQFAGACRLAGWYDESVPVLGELLRVREAKLGRKHADTLRTMQELGAAYLNAGRPRDAVPLLEEADAAAPPAALAGRDRGRLPEAYARAGERAKLEALVRDRRAKYRTDPRLVVPLVEAARWLIPAGAPAEAEPILRECLAALEKQFPDESRPGTKSAFTVRAALGAALLAQKKYAEAEPLLLKGYEAVKAHDQEFAYPEDKHAPEVLDTLIVLYTATGKPDEVRKWRAERARYPNLAPPPREKK